MLEAPSETLWRGRRRQVSTASRGCHALGLHTRKVARTVFVFICSFIHMRTLPLYVKTGL